MSATSQIMQVLDEHTIRVGMMASPGHWSYEAKKRGEGDWFAACVGDIRDGTQGCGWSSEPVNYQTRDQAREAGSAHLAEKIEEILP